MRRMMLSLAIICALTTALVAQQPPTPAFEVASVKPTQSAGETNFIRVNAGGRFVADGVTVSVLIQQAHDVFDFQIVGAPGWVDRERFDIQAIAPSLASVEQDVLLQRLLE